MLSSHYFTFFFFTCSKLVSDNYGPQCRLGSSWPERTLGTKLFLCTNLGHFCKKQKTKNELELSLRTLEMEIEPGCSWVCREGEGELRLMESGREMHSDDYRWIRSFRAFLYICKIKRIREAFSYIVIFLLLFLCLYEKETFFFFTLQLLRIFFLSLKKKKKSIEKL